MYGSICFLLSMRFCLERREKRKKKSTKQKERKGERGGEIEERNKKEKRALGSLVMVAQWLVHLLQKQR